MNIPNSMKAELQAWNNGSGINLEEWVGCTGNFSLAVGYAAIFCPEFFEFENYLFVGSKMTKELKKRVRGWEQSKDSTPRSVECAINYLSLGGIQHLGCPDLTADKLIILGNALKTTYEARLNYLSPDKPCVVVFEMPDVPEDPAEDDDYGIYFWQKRHD